MTTIHIFLTGVTGIGKTTIIDRFITNSGLTADGMITYWERQNFGERELFLSPYSNGFQNCEKKHLLARQINTQLIVSDDISSVFDSVGSEILDNSGKKDLIVIDELGFLESDSFVFQQAVQRRLTGNVPILGVIKPTRTEFLDKIRASPLVQVHEVTEKNRENLLDWLFDLGFCGFRRV